MTTPHDSVPYDHLGYVHLGGDLGASRYIPVPADWVVGDLVGLLLGAPEGVDVVRPDEHAEVPAQVGTGGDAVTGAPAPSAEGLSAMWKSRYETATILLATLLYKSDPGPGGAMAIQVHGAHEATTVLGEAASVDEARVLRMVDAYALEQAWL